jgi:hypothetical protein
LRCVNQRGTSASAFSICATRSALTAFACKHCTRLAWALGAPRAPSNPPKCPQSPRAPSCGAAGCTLCVRCLLHVACCVICCMVPLPFGAGCMLSVAEQAQHSYRLHVVVVRCNPSQQRPCVFVSVFPCGHRCRMFRMGCCSDAVRRGPVAEISASAAAAAVHRL